MVKARRYKTKVDHALKECGRARVALRKAMRNHGPDSPEWGKAKAVYSGACVPGMYQRVLHRALVDPDLWAARVRKAEPRCVVCGRPAYKDAEGYVHELACVANEDDQLRCVHPDPCDPTGEIREELRSGERDFMLGAAALSASPRRARATPRTPPAPLPAYLVQMRQALAAAPQPNAYAPFLKAMEPAPGEAMNLLGSRKHVTRAVDAELSRDALRRDGPLVDVVVRTECDDGSACPPRTVTALADTGASASALDASLVDERAVTSGSMSARGPTSGEMKLPVYGVDLKFPGAGSVRVDRMAATPHLRAQGIDALLGRDVLEHADLRYHGPTGRWTLDFPGGRVASAKNSGAGLAVAALGGAVAIGALAAWLILPASCDATPGTPGA